MKRYINIEDKKPTDKENNDDSFIITEELIEECLSEAVEK